MSEENPCLYLQNGTHPAINDRRLADVLFKGITGVATPNDLAVTERSGTANMSVDISGGSVAIQGTEAANQGAYLCFSSATVNLAVAASDPTNARYDLVVAKVEDSVYSGSANEWSLDVVTGTAAATPLYPSVPANAIVLAVITVDALASSIVDAKIADVRADTATDGTTTLGNAGYLAVLGGENLVDSTANVASPKHGDRVREIATNRPFFYDGTQWEPEGAVGARVYNSANISITSGALQELTFNSERWDTSAFHSTVSNTDRLTVPAAHGGIYVIAGHVAFAASGVGDRQIEILLNGTTSLAVSRVPPPSGQGRMSITTVVELSDADYITLRVLQTSGGALNVLAAGNYSPELSLVRIA